MSKTEKIYQVVTNMKSTYGGRAFSCKLMGGDQIMLYVVSYEKDFTRIKTVEDEMKKVFNETVKKLKEEYESEYADTISLKQLNETSDNQILGYGYNQSGGGAYMADASQSIRSSMVRVVRVYEVK